MYYCPPRTPPHTTHTPPVLIHRVDGRQITDAEEQDGGVVATRLVAGTCAVNLALRHLGEGGEGGEGQDGGERWSVGQVGGRVTAMRYL